eukprot:1266900-Rhodomonas_salina.2
MLPLMTRAVVVGVRLWQGHSCSCWTLEGVGTSDRVRDESEQKPALAAFQKGSLISRRNGSLNVQVWARVWHKMKCCPEPGQLHVQLDRKTS